MEAVGGMDHFRLEEAVWIPLWIFPPGRKSSTSGRKVLARLLLLCRFLATFFKHSRRTLNTRPPDISQLWLKCYSLLYYPMLTSFMGRVSPSVWPWREIQKFHDGCYREVQKVALTQFLVWAPSPNHLPHHHMGGVVHPEDQGMMQIVCRLDLRKWQSIGTIHLLFLPCPPGH